MLLGGRGRGALPLPGCLHVLLEPALVHLEVLCAILHCELKSLQYQSMSTWTNHVSYPLNGSCCAGGLMNR